MPIRMESLGTVAAKAIEDALARLEAALESGTVELVIGEQGAVAIDGWSQEDRNGLSDVCALRVLMADDSWALRQAMATAEAMSGRQVNIAAVSAGTHSHDGGSTWHPGHG
jgi:hypothetical protein